MPPPIHQKHYTPALWHHWKWMLATKTKLYYIIFAPIVVGGWLCARWRPTIVYKCDEKKRKQFQSERETERERALETNNRIDQLLLPRVLGAGDDREKRDGCHLNSNQLNRRSLGANIIHGHAYTLYNMHGPKWTNVQIQ